MNMKLAIYLATLSLLSLSTIHCDNSIGKAHDHGHGESDGLELRKRIRKERFFDWLSDRRRFMDDHGDDDDKRSSRRRRSDRDWIDLNFDFDLDFEFDEYERNLDNHRRNRNRDRLTQPTHPNIPTHPTHPDVPIHDDPLPIIIEPVIITPMPRIIEPYPDVDDKEKYYTEEYDKYPQLPVSTTMYQYPVTTSAYLSDAVISYYPTSHSAQSSHYTETPSTVHYLASTSVVSKKHPAVHYSSKNSTLMSYGSTTIVTVPESTVTTSVTGRYRAMSNSAASANSNNNSLAGSISFILVILSSMLLSFLI